MHTKFWLGKDELKYSDVDLTTIIISILEQYRVPSCGLDSSGSGQEAAASSCENGHEPSVSIEGKGL
jgi:hypothetical protein